MTKIKYNQNYKSKIRFKNFSIRFFNVKIANQNSANKTNTFNIIPNQEPMTIVVCIQMLIHHILLNMQGTSEYEKYDT